MAKKKAPKKTAPAAPQHTADELALLQKYPGRKIKPASLRFDKDRNKRVLVILCEICNGEREIATQDLFQVKLCTGCKQATKPKARPTAQARPAERTYEARFNGNDLEVTLDQLLVLVDQGEVLLLGTGRRIVQLEAGSYTVFDVPNDKEYGPYRDAAQAVKKAVSG